MSISDLIRDAETVDLFDDLSKEEKSSIKLKGEIAAAIFNKREDLRMTQKEFAEYMGVNQSMISKWESGDYNFSIETLSSIFDKLHLKMKIIDTCILSPRPNISSVNAKSVSPNFKSFFNSTKTKFNNCKSNKLIPYITV